MIDYIENEEHKFVEVHIKGKITKKDIEEIWKKLDPLTKEWGKIKVLKKFDQIPMIELNAILQNISSGMKHYKNFGSAAIVSDRQWVEKFSKFVGSVFGKNVKCFSSDQIQEARAWLADQPK